MKTDYEGHEAVYQRLRKQPGRVGWDNADQLATNIASLETVVRWPAFPKVGKVLELGCGAGNVSIELAKRGFDVHGIDISPTAIEWANQNTLQAKAACTFSVGNVLDLVDFQDNSFDIVLDGHCLHCIIGADRQQFFSNALRVLRPGGSLLIRTMCNEVPIGLVQRGSFNTQTRCAVSPGGLATRYIGWSNDIVCEVIDAGFRVVQMMIESADLNAEGNLDELLLLARNAPG
jgi:ubiquinone/menaquinone biosynthesis C-methylase UbiE